MDLYDVMRTTFAAREFTDDPLPDDVLSRIFDNARFAPSGGNRQGAHITVVRDAGVRRRLAELGAPAARRYFAQLHGGRKPVEFRCTPAACRATTSTAPRSRTRSSRRLSERRSSWCFRRPGRGRRTRSGPGPRRPRRRGVGLSAGMEHPAGRPQRGLRRHHHDHGHRRPRTKSATWWEFPNCMRSPRSCRSESRCDS